MAGNKHTRQVPKISEQERQELERWVRRPTTAQALAFRARIILEGETGDSDIAVAKQMSTTRETVGKWRRRFINRRCDGLLDDPRPGSPRTISDEDVERVIVKTLEEKPHGATHWSTRSMAKSVGLSQTAISRIWRAFGLKPHRVETFKLSTDPQFVEKVRDIVGLYMNPPEQAVVVCVDEKSQIQALNRTQPILPMRPGLPERMTHDYKRNGTTSLFAALNIATGEVLGKCLSKHRSAEFLRFLKIIDRNVPKQLDVHLVLDNYSTHKTALIQNWIVAHPRFVLHFTPTSSSWMNLIERWFAEITRDCIRRGSFDSTRSLVKSINKYIEEHNKEPKPFVWTKTAEDIFGSLRRYCDSICNSGH